ncbi:hypothetical protein [Hahella sp. HN01]|uniref:hypothetical protein n=1 Tax=Hahella sp. HN01 TaxID=2847262 RepID=UPI001C1F1E30|nr:hypothetical protein [Hahella sp. HN01]MBU6956063.1 hypothetical protein [Hahella sp. HN01]
MSNADAFFRPCALRCVVKKRGRNEKLPIKLFFILSVLCLVGCATDPTYLNPKPEEAGYLVGSIGKVITGEYKSPHSAVELYLRKIGTEDNVRISYFDPIFIPNSGDINEGGNRYEIFSLSLLPGNYEIYQTRFYYYNGQVEKDYYSKPDFSLPIEIEKGKMTYIGEFLAHGLWFKNIVGFKVPGAGFFEYNGDKLERDLPIINRKYPKIKTHVLKRIISDTASPFILTPLEVLEYKSELENNP